MSHLLTNLLLALSWAALSGEFSAKNFLIGFALGYLILSLQQRILGESTYYRKVYQFFTVLLSFVTALILSSFQVALDAITPRHLARPGIVAVPMDAETDFEIMLLANRVSLTPGTLSIEVSEDRSTLFVHVMFMEDPERVRRAIKEEIEAPLLELMR
jgi:multicomponent Na+:H+ antiporter subunit E